MHRRTGIAVERPKDLDPRDLTGTEDITPEDTGGADLGRLLERAYEKSYVSGLASHSMPSWNQILSSLRALDLLRKTAETAA